MARDARLGRPGPGHRARRRGGRPLRPGHRSATWPSPCTRATSPRTRPAPPDLGAFHGRGAATTVARGLVERQAAEICVMAVGRDAAARPDRTRARVPRSSSAAACLRPAIRCSPRRSTGTSRHAAPGAAAAGHGRAAGGRCRPARPRLPGGGPGRRAPPPQRPPLPRYRAKQPARWSFTRPQACIVAYAVTGPVKTKPCLRSSPDSAFEAGVCDGRSESVRGAGRAGSASA